MRHKDEKKHDAIIEATIKLVNEIGFGSASVSKIANEAGVSPATLYVYYRNKEDLIVSTYVRIKQKFGAAVLLDHDPSSPIRDQLQRFWTNAFAYIRKEPGFFQFSEQFSKTPYADLVNPEAIEKHFLPIFDTLRQGIEQKVIKDVSFDVLSVFMFYPVMQLANPRVCSGFGESTDDVDTAFTLAWDAIKL